jgi:16S rRNA (guanine966-N2)-methyltransferase
MRIIAGVAKGTKLKVVPGKYVRPTADRVKESLFQVVGPFFAGGLVLDLFAGTGAFGLEALSRGAERAIFIDRSAVSLAVVRENAEKAKLIQHCEIIRRDVRTALKGLQQRGLKCSFIFVDPPYHEKLLLPVLEKIAQTGLLDEEGIIVAEHSLREDLPARIDSLVRFRQLFYGSTGITLYRAGEE